MIHSRVDLHVPTLQLQLKEAQPLSCFFLFLVFHCAIASVDCGKMPLGAGQHKMKSSPPGGISACRGAMFDFVAVNPSPRGHPTTRTPVGRNFAFWPGGASHRNLWYLLAVSYLLSLCYSVTRMFPLLWFHASEFSYCLALFYHLTIIIMITSSVCPLLI